MRSAVKLSLALLAAVVAVGVPSSALATPVVDQYTEQLPTPGGPESVGPNNPGNPADGTSYGSGFTGSSPDGADTPTGSGASTTPADSAGSENQSDDTDKAGGAQQADDGTDDSLGAAATSGGDGDGDGMGWVFPAALVLIAMVIAGIAIVRRNRGNLAT